MQKGALVPKWRILHPTGWKFAQNQSTPKNLQFRRHLQFPGLSRLQVKIWIFKRKNIRTNKSSKWKGQRETKRLGKFVRVSFKCFATTAADTCRRFPIKKKQQRDTSNYLNSRKMSLVTLTRMPSRSSSSGRLSPILILIFSSLLSGKKDPGK